MKPLQFLLFAIALNANADAASTVNVPAIKFLPADILPGDVFSVPETEQLLEESEVGKTNALDRIWHDETSGCLQVGVYETGANRYTINEPYPYDELMVFITGGVTLTPQGGDAQLVNAGDTVLIPKGWLGLWDSNGYRKIYVIDKCADTRE